jgi:GNAT superfamily N-acetyltransferase
MDDSSTQRKQYPEKRVHIRWTIRRDMPEVLAIEAASTREPWKECWDEGTFLRNLRQRNCIGMVAEAGERIVGFMVYELHRDRIEVLKFAVAPEFRRRDVGTQMLQNLVSRLSPERRKRVVFTVNDHDLDTHIFLRDAKKHIWSGRFNDGLAVSLNTEVERGKLFGLDENYDLQWSDAYKMSYNIHEQGGEVPNARTRVTQGRKDVDRGVA